MDQTILFNPVKKLSLSQNRFSYPNTFETQCRGSVIFQTLNSLRLNSQVWNIKELDPFNFDADPGNFFSLPIIFTKQNFQILIFSRVVFGRYFAPLNPDAGSQYLTDPDPKRWLTPSVFKDIRLWRREFVAKTQFFHRSNSTAQN